jgi:flavin reductase (DIM6/NTAB) family NADH-FMN oxidoreductase RutF
MIEFNKKAIEDLEHLKKINLINSASGYKSCNLIGTKSNSGQSNLAIFSSVIHYGSSPAIYGFVLRPTTVKRDTYEHIKETTVYTINSVFNDIIEDAHHTSAKYPKEVSEFTKTHFEEEYKNNFYAPFIKNTPIQIAMKYLEEYYIKANGTILILGEIEKLYVNESILDEDFFIDLSKARIAAINGLDAYTVPKRNIRLPYQRIKK